MSAPVGYAPVVPLAETRANISPTRSERTRILGSAGRTFASPTPRNLNASLGNDNNGEGSSGGNVENRSEAGPSSAVPNSAVIGETGKKRRKKGWKGWALVIEDDNGNVLEINDGPEPDPIRPRRGRVGRASNSAQVEETKPEVIKSKSPSPYIDEPIVEDSSPITSAPRLSSSPKKTEYWKKKKEPVAGPSKQLREPEPELPAKRARQVSYSPLSSPPPVVEDVPKTASRPAPRHSLPKAKVKSKTVRASQGTAPARSQPSRTDTQPSTARATPILTPDERPVKATRNLEDLPAKTLRTVRSLDRSSPLAHEIRNEASMILAHAAKHRERISDQISVLSSPDDEHTPASSTRMLQPISPPPNTGESEPRIRTSADDDDLDLNEQSAEFDAAFENIKRAYRNGIRPSRNPYAPQARSVPVYGLEDANPPEWLDEQPPMIVTAPRSDRALPDDPAGRAYREGLDSLSDALATDAQGFLDNVKGNLANILTYYFPRPGIQRDAFVEHIGRGLADLGWQLTDSSVAALAPHSLPPLPPPGPPAE